ncbi:MAG: FecR domain-containing protein [Proteobacteria bacterium]|nr:FecR domain-containing protein [Pseudomonadota bacterium]MCP4922280.1 FecR domain-containing protein [Pseudomonadota bacterium]
MQADEPAWRWALPIAAVALLGLAPVLFGPPADEPSWSMTQLEGTSICAEESCELAEGDWLETDADSRVMLEVADIGHMEVAPETRLRLVATGVDEHRLELAEGRVDAAVIAPPRLLIVDTPVAIAVDLGCAYTLQVDPQGNGELIVSSGWVSLETDSYVAFVPAGAEARMDAERGPGTPVFWDASEEVRVAVHLVDAGQASLHAVLAESRPRDTLTLWHVLQRHPQDAVVDRIVELLPDVRVDRAAVLSGDAQALEALRVELEPAWI